jgi:hypothetical protein
MFNNEPIELSNNELPKYEYPHHSIVFSIFTSSTRNMLLSSSIAIALLSLHKKQLTYTYQIYIAKIISLTILAFSFFTGFYSIKELNLYMNTIKNKYSNKELPDVYKTTFNNWNTWIYVIYIYMIVLFSILLVVLFIEFTLQK